MVIALKFIEANFSLWMNGLYTPFTCNILHLSAVGLFHSPFVSKLMELFFNGIDGSVVEFTNFRQKHQKCMFPLSFFETCQKIFAKKRKIFPWQFFSLLLDEFPINSQCDFSTYLFLQVLWYSEKKNGMGFR